MNTPSYKNLGDDEKAIWILEKLGLGHRFRDTKYLEKKLSWKQELLKLYRKTCEDKFDFDIMHTINKIADTLEKLGRKADARREREKFATKLKEYLEKFGKADEKTAEKMETLTLILHYMESPEKEVWVEKRKNLLRELVKKKLSSPIADIENVISEIENFIECLSADLPAEYQEIIDLRRKILRLLEENNFDEEIILSEKDRLARCLRSRSEGCEEALKLFEEVAEQNKNLYGPTDDSTIYAIRDVAQVLEDMGNKSAALEKRKEILQILTDNDGDAQQILSAMEDIAYYYGSRRGIKNYNEALTWRKKILEFCRKNFVADGPEVIYALENLTDALKNLNLDSSEYREELAKIKAENLSEEHSDAISAKEDIADDLHERGKYAEEIELRLQIIDLYKKNFDMGGDFRNIVYTMEKLAKLYEHVGRTKDSLDTWKKIVELYENEIAESEENSSATIKILKKIPCILSINIGDTAKEFKTLNRILAISEKIYSPGSREIIRAKSDIARFYKSQGDDCKALQIRLEILNTRKENFQKALSELGTDDAEVIRLIADLAEDLKKLHFEEEAAEKYDEHLNTCRRVADKLEKDFGETDEQVTDLLNYLKKNLIRRREYRESLKVCRRIIEIYKKKYNGNEAESDIIDSLDDEADILSNLKKYPEELNIRRKIFELYRNQRHGNISEDSIDALQEVADCYNALEDFVGGLKVYDEELLSLIRKKYDGDGTQDEFLRALKKKADIFKDTENFDEACKLREEIYNLFREKFGKENETTLEILEECADAFKRAGIYEKALHFQQKLVNIVCKNFNPNFDVDRVLISLAEILEKCGRKDDALRERGRIVAQTENLLNSTIEIYGENSKKTLEILNLLAKNLSDVERFKEEIQTRERIKNICEKIYGKTSQKYVTATEVVAKVYSDNDRTEEALNLRKEIADIRRELLNSLINLVGTNHKDTISARKSLADVLEEIGESGAAKNLREENLNAFKEIADFRRKKFGVEHKITLQTLKEYAQELEGTDKSEDALKIFREIVVALKEKFLDEEDAPEIIDALKNEADFLKHCNDYEEEEKIRREILNLCEKRFNFNPAYSETIFALENLATCLQEIKKFDEAVRIRREIINRLAEKYFENNLHSEVITAKKKLATTFEISGNYEAAVKEREKILEDLKKKFEKNQNGDNEISVAENELRRVKNLRDGIQEDKIFGEAEEVKKKFDDLSDLLKNADVSESINLRKDQKVDLTKNNPDLKNLVIYFERENSSADEIEIDGSACVLYGGGKVKKDEDFIFFNNPLHESGSVEFIQMSEEENSALKIYLEKIPKDAEKISFTLSIYEGDERGQNFSQISGATIRIIDSDTAKELMRFNLDENFTVETGIVAGEVYRHKGNFKFHATGAGFVGGLESLCKNFGVAIE